MVFRHQHHVRHFRLSIVMMFLRGLMPPRPNGLDNTNNTPKILTKAFHPPKIPRCDILKEDASPYYGSCLTCTMTPPNAHI